MLPETLTSWMYKRVAENRCEDNFGHNTDLCTQRNMHTHLNGAEANAELTGR